MGGVTKTTKTTPQLEILQTKAQALSQTLIKEVIIATKDEQHIKGLLNFNLFQKNLKKPHYSYKKPKNFIKHRIFFVFC